MNGKAVNKDHESQKSALLFYQNL